MQRLRLWFRTRPKWQRISLVALLFLILVGLTSWWAADYYGWFRKEEPKVTQSDVSKPETPAPQTPKPTSVPYKVEEVASNLFVPWAIVFTSKDRMIVTERSGAVRVIQKGTVQPAPLTTFGEVATGGEEGLMGLAKDPHFDQNKYLYTCIATEAGGRMHDKVVRFSDTPGGGERKTLLDNIPAAQYHAGCRVKFGPDGKLYVTTGDATNRAIAQDKNSLGGKILRINADGSIPSDNPFGSPIWSYGHRNPQGLDWQPGTNILIATEHGPSGFDGPLGGDEVNLIEKGGNYGWPLVSHNNTREGTKAPMLVFTPAVAPADGHFYRSDVLPQFTGNYFFGMLKGEGLYRVVFDKQDAHKIISHEKVSEVNVGRVREVTEGPDGAIYFTSSNQDGRGTAKTGDDKIYRITPQ